MKKILILILSLIITLSLFTACGGSSSTDTSGEGASQGDSSASDFDPYSAKTFNDIFEFVDKENNQEAFTEEKYVFAFPLDDKYYRAETTLTQEQSDALFGISFDDEERGAKIQEIVGPLEITSFEELTEKAPTQEELDAFVGKTGGELFDQGWEYNYYDLEAMEAGLDHGVYSFTVKFEYDGEPMVNTDDFDFYEEFRDLKIASITCEGVGHAAYIGEAEGTW